MDRVDRGFLNKELTKMKFPRFVIKWIETLYTNIQSLLLVNGHFTNCFDIRRGV